MLRDVVLTQKAELEKALNETYVERDIEPFSIEHNLIKVVMGPRRAGKSFFCLHTLNKKGIFGYVNFDNETLITIKNYDDLIAEIKRVYLDPQILFFRRNTKPAQLGTLRKPITATRIQSCSNRQQFYHAEQ